MLLSQIIYTFIFLASNLTYGIPQVPNVDLLGDVASLAGTGAGQAPHRALRRGVAYASPGRRECEGLCCSFVRSTFLPSIDLARQGVSAEGGANDVWYSARPVGGALCG